MARGQSRRSFLKAASSVAALSAVRPFAARAQAAQAAAPELREFDYKEVRLTGGPLKEQYDHIHAHYLGLDNDRLLKVYRQHAGLAAPGRDMGGWYDPDGFEIGRAHV